MSKPSETTSINKILDHTFLSPFCDYSDITKICEEAINHEFGAVCIPPFFIKKAKSLLQDYPIKVVAVIGFPFGYSTTAAKVEEIKRAIDDGADEVDVVINIAALKSQEWSYLANDISSMTTAAHLRSKVIKVIIEMGKLSDEELSKVCEICNEVVPNFVKTSTGFNHKHLNQVEGIKRLRNMLVPNIKIKASGGIKNQEQVLQLLEAGVDRIGTSSGLAVIGVS